MNIGIDLDGTLCDTYPILLGQLNEEFNLQMQYKDCVTYELVRGHLGVSQELSDDVFTRLKFILHNNQTFYTGLPLMNALDVDFIKSREELGDKIFYITKRNEHLRLPTYEWLEKNKLSIKNVHFDCNKSEICRKLDINYYFEDAPIEYINLRAEGIHTFLIQQPYNMGLLSTTRLRFIHEAKL